MNCELYHRNLESIVSVWSQILTVFETKLTTLWKTPSLAKESDSIFARLVIFPASKVLFSVTGEGDGGKKRKGEEQDSQTKQSLKDKQIAIAKDAGNQEQKSTNQKTLPQRILHLIENSLSLFVSNQKCQKQSSKPCFVEQEDLRLFHPH